MKKFVGISLPIPTEKLFTYRILEPGEDSFVGKRALIKFNKRVMTGVVITESDECELEKVSDVLEILDHTRAYSAKMIEFAQWIANYYMVSLGEILKAALPQGMSPKSIIKVIPNYDISPELISRIGKKAPKRAALLDILSKRQGYVSVNYLKNELNSEHISIQLQALQDQGIIDCEVFTAVDIKPKQQKGYKIIDLLLNNSKKLKIILDELDVRAPKQSLLLSSLYLKMKSSGEPQIAATLLKETNISPSAAKALIDKGLIKEVDIEIMRDKNIVESTELSSTNELELPLNSEQQIAVQKINENIGNNSTKPLLLFGITGSGKTLVYMKSIEQVVESGKSALLLVPEISLTPQLIDRFNVAFPGKTAVLHSKMSIGERYDSWRRIKTGRADIVIGARSAIFAPLSNLGIIIVDEEHEPSYKQDTGGPYYNARDCAVIRAKIENCPIVFGSATPSIESMYNANTGKFSIVNINERADGAVLPEIRTINTLDMRKSGMMKGNFSRLLIDEIKSRIEKKEGIILFQNRRGFSFFIECTNCGYIPMCINCDITLTYHKHQSLLRCHYCGYTKQLHKTCESCRKEGYTEVGSGTQRIEDELAEILKDEGVEARIARVDLDTTSRKNSFRKILTDFKQGFIDILVGTQMVAKGLDFEKVTLIGVINADLHLHMPFFRAGERTYQLLTQVAGRAGRSSHKKGSVIIQTSNPGHNIIRAVSESNYEKIYNDEVKIRREINYPPFSRFIYIEFKGKKADAVSDCASFFYRNMLSHKSLIIFSPVIPAVSMIKNLYRKIIVVKNLKSLDPTAKILRASLSNAVAAYEKNYSKTAVRMSIDIDSFSGI